jgi:hypothetical protein
MSPPNHPNQLHHQ